MHTEDSTRETVANAFARQTIKFRMRLSSHVPADYPVVINPFATIRAELLRGFGNRVIGRRGKGAAWAGS